MDGVAAFGRQEGLGRLAKGSENLHVAGERDEKPPKESRVDACTLTFEKQTSHDNRRGVRKRIVQAGRGAGPIAVWPGCPPGWPVTSVREDVPGPDSEQIAVSLERQAPRQLQVQQLGGGGEDASERGQDFELIREIARDVGIWASDLRQITRVPTDSTTVATTSAPKPQVRLSSWTMSRKFTGRCADCDRPLVVPGEMERWSSKSTPKPLFSRVSTTL